MIITNMQKAQKEGGSVDGGEEGQAYSFVQRRADTALVQGGMSESQRSHRGNKDPRPQPQTFRQLMFLVEVRQSYIFLNW